MMHYFFIRLLLLLTTPICNKEPEPVTCTVNYAGFQLCFNPTVGEAVKRYKLDYRPTGDYYKDLEDGTLMQLYFQSKKGDFSNERQEASVLYDRICDSYRFEIPDTPGRFERELKCLEALIGHKMHLSKETPLLLNYMTADQIAALPGKGIFTLAEGWNEDSVHVFLRTKARLSPTHKPTTLGVFFTKRKNPVEVRYITHANY